MKDTRSTVIIVILVACIFIMMLTIVASASYGMGLSARAAALYEPVTDTFIYEKNATERLPMASTTKIMTALLAIELCGLDETVTVPSEAIGVEGSSLYLKEGDRLTIENLVYSLLLQSANDAAVALALKISGDVGSFAALMNERARAMGLCDTNFDNPHGLDSETHYTTARDLAVMASVAMENPTFKRIASTNKYSFEISEKPRTLVNHNKLLRSYSGATGVKTGYTKRCGRCLVSSAERDGLSLIAVTLDAPDDWRDHTKMLDLGFSEYEAVSVEKTIKTKYTLPLLGSEKTSVSGVLEAPENIRLVKRRHGEEITAVADILPYAIAPLSKGDKLGEVTFFKNGEVIAKASIVAAEGAEEQKKNGFNLSDIFKTRR